MALIWGVLSGLTALVIQFWIPAIFALAVWLTAGLFMVLANRTGCVRSAGAVIALATVGWGLATLLLYPWLVGLGMDLDVALRRLFVVGGLWGLCVGRAVAQQWDPGRPADTDHTPSRLLKVTEHMLTPEGDEVDDVDLEALFKDGVVLGVDADVSSRR
jgi:hypothetical protein